MSAVTEKKQSSLPPPLDSIMAALNSLPVAIVVMLILTILQALGTFIPQEHLARPDPGMTMDQMYAERFGELVYKDIQLGSNLTLKVPQSKHAMLDSLGFKHVYFTPYFFLLLVWLAVSAIVCNITRFKRTMRLWREPKVLKGGGFFRADKRAVVLDGGTDEKVGFISGDLKAKGYRVRQMTQKDGTVCIYADKSFWKQWALLVLHASILVLILGGAYGKIYGVEDYVRMADGERKSLTLDLVKGKIKLVHPLVKQVAPITYDLAQDNFHIDYDKNIQMPGWIKGAYERGEVPEDILPYYLYFVKEFVSDFTMSRNGKTVTREVKVNHPVKLDKLVMYQSGYQQVGYIDVTIDGVSKEMQVFPDRWLGITEGGLVDGRNAMGMGNDVADLVFYVEQVKAGELFIKGESQGMMGPLTICRLTDGRTGQSKGSFLMTPDKGFDTKIGDKNVTVKMSKRVDNYSDFSYKRDPGIPILYLGWIAMIVGISFAMYIPFAQIWLRFEPKKTYALVAGGGSAVADSTYSKWNDMLKR